MKKVLVLEDESSIRNFIVINLRRAGYEVIEAGTGEEALEMLQQHSDIRVALLDVMLPGIDGFEVCRRIRATNSRIGIIMLTARSQEMDKVTGLMTGADDYVTKPFSPAELTARVDALMRRSGGSMEEHSGEISQPPFLLNTRNRTLEKNGKPVKLTQVEYSIMRMFTDYSAAPVFMDAHAKCRHQWNLGIVPEVIAFGRTGILDDDISKYLCHGLDVYKRQEFDGIFTAFYNSCIDG